MSRRHRLPVPAVLLIPLTAAFFGGWATITLDRLPDQVAARQPLELSFMVRQHGVTPLRGLTASVTARAERGGGALRAVAVEQKEAGHYAATLVLPEPGEWTVTVYSGFGNSNLTLPPLAVVAPGTATRALAAADLGRRLFVAKGCVTCHLHREVAGSGTVAVGPELTERGAELAPEYLARFLADPSIKAPTPGSDARMPNLGLAPEEIAALSAFLTGGGARRASQ